MSLSKAEKTEYAVNIAIWSAMLFIGTLMLSQANGPFDPYLSYKMVSGFLIINSIIVMGLAVGALLINWIT